jgi:hypothetical protein
MLSSDCEAKKRKNALLLSTEAVLLTHKQGVALTDLQSLPDHKVPSSSSSPAPTPPPSLSLGCREEPYLQGQHEVRVTEPCFLIIYY